jgi:hypothetical protein
MDKFISIEAKYDSKCFICKRPLPEGTQVWWRKGDRVRCDEHTPHEMRSLFLRPDPERRKRQEAAERRDGLLGIRPFVRRDPDGIVDRLLPDLERATEPDEINSLIDEIIELGDLANSA